MAEERMAFGSVSDTDDSLQSKSGGKFGLNTNARITKLEYNDKAGKDNSAGDAVDVTIKVGEREFMSRLFDVTKVFDAKGRELSPNDPEFNKGYNTEIKQRMAVIVHHVKATGVSQEQIDEALKTPAANFAQWAKIVTGLVPNDFSSKQVDVFLEYQWQPTGDNDKTFLQLPKNMKGGYFVCPAVPHTGEWKEVKGDDGSLSYQDDNGNKHPFERSANYMDSPKAIQQGGADSSQIEGQTSPEAQQANTGSW